MPISFHSHPSWINTMTSADVPSPSSCPVTAPLIPTLSIAYLVLSDSNSASSSSSSSSSPASLSFASHSSFSAAGTTAPVSRRDGDEESEEEAEASFSSSSTATNSPSPSPTAAPGVSSGFCLASLPDLSVSSLSQLQLLGASPSTKSNRRAALRFSHAIPLHRVSRSHSHLLTDGTMEHQPGLPRVHTDPLNYRHATRLHPPSAHAHSHSHPHFPASANSHSRSHHTETEAQSPASASAVLETSSAHHLHSRSSVLDRLRESDSDHIKLDHLVDFPLRAASAAAVLSSFSASSSPSLSVSVSPLPSPSSASPSCRRSAVRTRRQAIKLNVPLDLSAIQSWKQKYNNNNNEEVTTPISTTTSSSSITSSSPSAAYLSSPSPLLTLHEKSAESALSPQLALTPGPSVASANTEGRSRSDSSECRRRLAA